MDTVLGRMGGKVLLTFNLSFCNFIFARLLDNKTALEVTKHLYDADKGRGCFLKIIEYKLMRKDPLALIRFLVSELMKKRSTGTKRVWDKSLTLNIKSEQNELSDTQNSVLFAFLSNLSILEIYNKEFLKSKSFCPSLFIRLTFT